MKSEIIRDISSQRLRRILEDCVCETAYTVFPKMSATYFSERFRQKSADCDNFWYRIFWKKWHKRFWSYTSHFCNVTASPCDIRKCYWRCSHMRSRIYETAQRSSVCLSVCPIIRPPHVRCCGGGFAAVGLATRRYRSVGRLLAIPTIAILIYNGVNLSRAWWSISLTSCDFSSELTPRIPRTVYRYFWAHPFLLFSFPVFHF